MEGRIFNTFLRRKRARATGGAHTTPRPCFSQAKRVYRAHACRVDGVGFNNRILNRQVYLELPQRRVRQRRQLL